MFEKIKGFTYEENVKDIVNAYNHLPNYKRSNVILEVIPFTLANLQKMNANDLLLLDVDFPQDTEAYITRVVKIDFEERNNGFYYLDTQTMFWISSIYGYEGRIAPRLIKDSGLSSFLLAGYNEKGNLVSYGNTNEDVHQNRFILKVRDGGERLFDTKTVSDKAKTFLETTDFSTLIY